jgi:hypothetical protein
MDTDPTRARLKSKLAERLFGQSIVQNNFRGELVEEIVNCAIGNTWRHCSNDWSAWDFERDGVNVDVKQAAARQSWDQNDEEPRKFTRGKFHINRTSGYYDGNNWKSKLCRHVHIYILCWHGIDNATADHFEVLTWEFFILPVTAIKDTKENPKNTISVSELRQMERAGLVRRIGYSDLSDALDDTASKIDISQSSRA